MDEKKKKKIWNIIGWVIGIIVFGLILYGFFVTISITQKEIDTCKELSRDTCEYEKCMNNLYSNGLYRDDYIACLTIKTLEKKGYNNERI